MAAGPLRTGNDENLVRPRFQSPHQVEAFDPAAAWQRKEAEPGTEFFFERSPVEILGGIKLLTEKKGIPQLVFFEVHNPPLKKNGDV